MGAVISNSWRSQILKVRLIDVQGRLHVNDFVSRKLSTITCYKHSIPWRSHAVPDEILEKIKQLTLTVLSTFLNGSVSSSLYICWSYLTRYFWFVCWPFLEFCYNYTECCLSSFQSSNLNLCNPFQSICPIVFVTNLGWK